MPRPVNVLIGWIASGLALLFIVGLPVVALVCVVIGFVMILVQGPWNERLLWLWQFAILVSIPCVGSRYRTSRVVGALVLGLTISPVLILLPFILAWSWIRRIDPELALMMRIIWRWVWHREDVRKKPWYDHPARGGSGK